ncbi:hypothetical protein O181_060695 [Austropuccinia psidii MF-1]|uniref:Zn(2)-C6 fungal-type domain-containing protein n=1 Tax=Austropuccinia psidii MF-1 TaxID=1389203 RepID=A0A9Q3EDS2_9BASI|nr:hypothetical protein [Austropuccinia psidii MF-1]
MPKNSGKKPLDLICPRVSDPLNSSINQIQSRSISPQNSSRKRSKLEDVSTGPVFLELPRQVGWTKVNNFSACDHCRASHIKCSLWITGGPCNHCRNRNGPCQVHEWTFNPRAPPHYIYKPVLPPPSAGPPSPGESPEYSNGNQISLDIDLLIQKLRWLEEKAPLKFRKRATAMPWKESFDPIPDRFSPEPPEFHSTPHSRPKRKQNSQILKSPQKFSRLDSNLDFSAQVLERQITSTFESECDFKHNSLSSKEKMSLPFILSSTHAPCEIAKRDERWEQGSTRRSTPEADWSSMSYMLSPSPPLEALRNNMGYPAKSSPRIPSIQMIDKNSSPILTRDSPPSFSCYSTPQHCTLPSIWQILAIGGNHFQAF